MSSNLQPQDCSPNAFPTELYPEICRMWFKLLLYNAKLYSYSVTFHCIITWYTSCIEHVSYYFYENRKYGRWLNWKNYMFISTITRSYIFLHKIIMHKWRDGTMWKTLSQGIHLCHMKALSLLVWKLWPRLKFFKSGSNFKVNVIMSKFIVSCERSCHKEYTCVIWKPSYHFWFESYGQG